MDIGSRIRIQSRIKRPLLFRDKPKVDCQYNFRYNYENNKLGAISLEIYNIIAELCSEIIHFCEEDFFIRFSCVCTDEKNRIDGIIKEKIPGLFEKDHQGHILTEADLTDEFYVSVDADSSSLMLNTKFGNREGKEYYVANYLASSLVFEI